MFEEVTQQTRNPLTGFVVAAVDEWPPPIHFLVPAGLLALLSALLSGGPILAVSMNWLRGGADADAAVLPLTALLVLVALLAASALALGTARRSSRRPAASSVRQ
ncbi:hypothetical protein [Nocardia sp. NBC_00511]|uniref:hypothetical protein n=1 Tax=Nocardia sp. NBC_00511 TaxID=2903591 RepID=UPI0030E28C42